VYWTGRLRIPRCARTSIHRLVIDILDRAGRGLYYGYHGKKLIAPGVPSKVDVIAAKDTYLPTATRRWLGPRRVLVRFDAGVINVTARNLPLVDYRPSRHVTRTRVSCQDADRKQVPCTGRDALVRPAILTVVKGDTLSRSRRVYPNIWGVTPQVSDRSGNAVWKDMAPET
jgi:hypothetical protein